MSKDCKISKNICCSVPLQLKQRRKIHKTYQAVEFMIG